MIMRKSAYFILPLILLVTMACSISVNLPDVNIERGSGRVVTEQREVSGFDQLDFSGVGKMTITQGNRESLTVEADDNVIDHITSEVIGSRLVIGYEKGQTINTPTTIRYTLVVKDLTKLDLSGFGDINVDQLETDSFTLDLSGAGNLTVDELQAADLRVVMSGFGNAEISGEVLDLRLDISGTGNFKGGDLLCQTANVDVSGFGNATVWVENDLDVTISGTGNVSYFGSPRISQEVSGLGRLKDLGRK
jgi:hypothetical protein